MNCPHRCCGMVVIMKKSGDYEILITKIFNHGDFQQFHENFEPRKFGAIYGNFIEVVRTIAQPYNSDSEVEFLALVKLEGLTNIPVLTAIEKNAEKFMDTAGFKLVHSRRRKVRIAYEYIESWKKEKIRYYEPTWKGFFAVLRQIGLNSLATSIDNILRKTSPSEPIEQLAEHKDPENGI